MAGSFGSAFVLLRIQQKMKQGAVAKIAGVDPSYLAAIEKGRRRPPARETLEHLLLAVNAKEEDRRRLRSLAAMDRLVEAADSVDLNDEPVVRLTRLLPLMASFSDDEWLAVEWMMRGWAFAKQRGPAAS
jgi:transcriptional regulator with XRE-family HTH domain